MISTAHISFEVSYWHHPLVAALCNAVLTLRHQEAKYDELGCWTMSDNALTNQGVVRQCATSPQWASLGISQKNIEEKIQPGREAKRQEVKKVHFKVKSYWQHCNDPSPLSLAQ